jgi:hypothetical protein
MTPLEEETPEESRSTLERRGQRIWTEPGTGTTLHNMPGTEEPTPGNRKITRCSSQEIESMRGRDTTAKDRLPIAGP